MPTDPLTVEHEQSEESLLELEQRVSAQQAQEQRNAQNEVSIFDLEQKLLSEVPVYVDPEADDGFWNNAWEVTGSAAERSAEQVIRSLGDLTSFAEDAGGRITVADPEHLPEDDQGFGIPFTDKRIAHLSMEQFNEQAVQYEIATGKQPMGISDIDFPDVDRPDSTAGAMTSGFLQWGLVFAATRKAGLGNISGSVIADFAAFDPHEARLADLATQLGEGNPIFDNAFTQYMSADPTDSNIEGRLKNALEGLLIGGAIEGTMASFRWMRAYRVAKKVSRERNLKDAKILEPKAAPIADAPTAEVSATVDGNVTRHATEAGVIDVVSRGGKIAQIVNVEVDAAARGAGVGTELYRAAAKQADDAGLRLVSDTKVSESAARRWDAMAKAGDDIIDQRITNPDNVKLVDGNYTTQNGTPLFERGGKAAKTADEALDGAARATLRGEKVAETFHDVALRQLKASLNADPAKLRLIRKALESGDTQVAAELIDFNHSTVDWESLGKQLGDGESVDEFVKIINAFSDVFSAEMKAATGFQSQAETLARSVGTTADDVLKLGLDVKGGIGLSGRMAGADTFLYQSTQELRRLAKLATGGTDADMMSFFRQMDLHATLQATIKGSKSEIARALNQMQRVSTSHLDDFKEFDDLMRDSTGLTGDKRRHLAQKIADLKDMNQINQIARKSLGRRSLDVWVEIYVNGLLSAIATLMLNNASNTLKLIEGISERYFAAGIGAVKNGTRSALRMETKEAITFREANAYLYGTMQGLDAAMRIPFKQLFSKAGRDSITAEDFGAVYRVFVDEKPVLDTRMRVDIDTRKAISMLDESDLSLAQGLRQLDLSKVDLNAKAVNSLGKLVRMPGRLIMTSDEFFKQITYNQHLASQAYKDGSAIALAKGKTGKQRAAIIERTHRNYSEFPPESVRFEAMDHARYQTFQSDLPDGLARDFESLINRHPAMKFVIPFYRTPVNIVKQTILERSPIGFIKLHKSELYRRINAGGPQGDIALARLATGSAFMGWAMTQAMNGKITGGGLSTVSAANSEDLDNIPPYSFEFQGSWIQYSRLEPMGMLMGLGADLALAAEWYQDDDDTEFMEAASLAITVVTANITDKTWFKGVADMVSAFEDPKRFAGNYAKQMTTTMVTPYSALLRRINTDHDQIAREAWSWMDKWKAGMPGFSEDLPVQFDLLGKPRYKRDYLGPAWASPVAMGEDVNDPVYKEVVRLAFDYRKPRRDLFGTGQDVTNEVYSDVMSRKAQVIVSGKTLHENLEDLFDSGLYEDTLSDEGKADVVKGIISSYTQAAKGDFLQDNPDFLDGVVEAKQEKSELRLK